MIYQAVFPKIDAEPVEIFGERWFSFKVDGRLKAIPCDVFQILYGAETPTVPAPDIPTVARPPKAEVRKQQSTAAKPAATNSKASPLQQRVVDILANGPLTMAELAEAVYPELDRKTACTNIYPLTAGCKDKGLITKKADPDAGGIPKWFKL